MTEFGCAIEEIKSKSELAWAEFVREWNQILCEAISTIEPGYDYGLTAFYRELMI